MINGKITTQTVQYLLYTLCQCFTKTETGILHTEEDAHGFYHKFCTSIILRFFFSGETTSHCADYKNLAVLMKYLCSSMPLIVGPSPFEK